MIRGIKFDFRVATCALLALEAIGAIIFTVYLIEQADKINQKAAQARVNELSLATDNDVTSKHNSRSIVGRAIYNNLR